MQDAGATLGLAHFIAQADAVGKIVLAILLVMSIASWYVIVTKGTRLVTTRTRSEKFLRFFWNAPDLTAVQARVRATQYHDPFSELTHEGFVAIEQHRRGGTSGVVRGGSDEFLTRALRRALDRTTARAESGLTVLASVGSSAPFVGLFGTVWGIYHALLAIGVSGQGTLDKVAGPVGEALIMTAAGLAVAIPAVLGYNALVRSNRVLLAELDSFAHDAFAFMATGRQAVDAAADVAAGETKVCVRTAANADA